MDYQINVKDNIQKYNTLQRDLTLKFQMTAVLGLENKLYLTENAKKKYRMMLEIIHELYKILLS